MRSLVFSLLCLLAVAGHAADDFPVPEGYVLQRLDPTDGKVAMPKDWFYSGKMTPSGWMWTMAAEDPAGFYETGMRIQGFVDVNKNTHRSAEAFAKGVLQNKREHGQVVKDCPESEQGLFKRQCLELIETLPTPTGNKVYHIVYSAFWRKEWDMVVMTTFGAPQDKWEAAKPVNEVMSHIELIGPDFGKTP